MQNIEQIATDLFNKIRSRFDSVTVGDEDGKNTDDPEQGRFFNFTYISSDGTEHGDITATIIDNKSLKLTFSQDIGVGFSPEQESEWEDFLRNLRKFAKRHLISFDIRDINRTNLKRRDINQMVRSQSSYKSGERAVSESIQWHGTTRTSIQEFGPVRLIVRHSERVDELKPGARSRKIESMFVETDMGERFRMPHNRLSLGRAMAQHIAHGGHIYDEPGQHIQEMAEEMSNLSFFVRNTRHRQFEDIETQGMVESAIERYKLLRSSLNKMARTRGYHQFAETFVPETNIDNDYDIDALKERFVKRMFDERLTAALPYVYRAYQSQGLGEERYMGEFAGWVDRVGQQEISEDIDVQKLSELMAEPIKAGDQGIDAIAAISSVIDNEELNDLISQASQTQGSQADMRVVIDDWMLDNYPEYTSLMPQENPSSAPTHSDSNTTTGQINPKESLDLIRQLAGLR